jgi:cellulose synthase (UDP-forming)
MILIGIISAGLFTYGILQEEYIGFKPLYYPLIFALLFIILRISYEWYHYWDISVPETPILEKQYTVDILTTFVPGEPYDMLVETLEAIQKITYPHTTYLCDEGNDPYLIEQCKRLGVKHVTREIKVNAKAGNINNALQQATGEICLILDPDHIPAPDFLDWVLPHFNNPEIGFVQVVQGYYNIYENIIAKGSAQQTFQFYGPIMMSMNSYGTAQAIGANCTFRRAALDSIGGHAPGLAEDMNTSMKLHGKGWKSSYVPRMLTRGLVPNTLSAYYQQQLKWSRGVFELLVTTYVENFSKLNLRQKIHYGILPWNYFTGFIYLINFLIPILSLILGANPMTMSLWNFVLLGVPFTASTLIIRHYVQKWVMEEDERGFHLQGGLMMIGTWWIHSLGFIFTILRRKVPYNPTPKDGKEENIWALNIPNLVVAGVSILAIIYGLLRDFNPYNLIMAGFALMNVFFMAFMVMISMQNRYRRYLEKHAFAKKIDDVTRFLKDRFWRLRRRSYVILRYTAAPLLVAIIVLLYQQSSLKEIENISIGPKPAYPVNHLLGATYQKAQTNQTSSCNIQKINFNWNAPISDFQKGLNAVWAKNQYPLISFKQSELNSSADLMMLCDQLILGSQNNRMSQFAEEIMREEKPVLISFLPPFDSLCAGLAEIERIALGKKYRQAWRYIYEFFRKSGVNNIISVYHASDPKNIDRFFPGLAYVDWLKTDLSESLTGESPLYKDFQKLYVSEAYSLELPVILELNSHFENHKDLYNNYKSLSDSFAQIGGLMVKDFSCLSATLPFPKPLQEKRKFAEYTAPQISQNELDASTPLDYPMLAGVNYYKGSDWQATRNPLFRETLENDFREMNQLGLKTIKRTGPGFYDFNILNQAEQSEHQILYGFWTAHIKSFEKDLTELAALKELILNSVSDKMGEKSIIAWHLGGANWNKLGFYHNQPELNFERNAYLRWLADISFEIKKLDPSRSISIEIDSGPFCEENIKHILKQVPFIDAVGININPTQKLPQQIDEDDLIKLRTDVFINSCPAQYAPYFKKLKIGFLLEAWQDEIFSTKVSFNGLKTLNGEKKQSFLMLTESNNLALDQIRILPVAKPVIGGMHHRYQALIKTNGKWRALSDQDRYTYHWKLVKYDYNEQPIALKELNGSHVLDLIVPYQAYHYKLHLDISIDELAISTTEELHPPLYRGPYLENYSRREIEAFLKNRN